jgi:hypothetical protein
LVWVELAPPPFWLESAAMVDKLAGWCRWTLGISLKVECSEPTAMVGRVSVDGSLVLGRGLGLSFVWMETLADSFGWHY